MPCYTRTKDGAKQHICGKFGEHCQDSRCAWVSDFLCDYPVGNDKSCDRSLCTDHAYEVAPDTHYCGPHYEQWKEFRDGGGVKSVLENVVPFKLSEQ